MARPKVSEFLAGLTQPSGSFKLSPFGVDETQRGVSEKSRRTFVHNLVHEVGTSQTDESVDFFDVPPSSSKTRVKLKYTIINRGATGPASNEYQATVRRRKARKLKEAISDLATWQASDEFCIQTSPILDKVREFVRDLGPAPNEGNTRAVLRYVRDSFLDGGWEKYREAKVRQAVEGVLELLASADELTPKDVKDCRAELEATGLQPFPISGLLAERKAAENGEEAP